MKLLCVNAKIIKSKKFHHTGDNLVEGEIYITNCKQFTDEDGFLCYYIEGLGAKLACRFAELLEEDKSEAEKAIEKLKKEMELS